MELPILINHDREKQIGWIKLEIPNVIIEFDDGKEPTRDEFFNIFGGAGVEILEYITPPSTVDEYKGDPGKFRIKKARILEFSMETSNEPVSPGPGWEPIRQYVINGPDPIIGWKKREPNPSTEGPR